MKPSATPSSPAASASAQALCRHLQASRKRLGHCDACRLLTCERVGAGKDLETDKKTYPKLLGLEKSREFVEEWLRDEKEQLKDFHLEKAQPLLYLANFIAY